LYKFVDWTTETFYFKANFEGKNIFIKLLKHENKNIREAEVLKYISNCESESFASKLIYESPIKTKSVIVTEIIEGEVLKEKNIDFELFLLITDQFIEILNSLQKLDIVHCDIRPNNIIITPSKQVKLIDFEYAICKSIQNLNNLKFENKLILQNLGEEYSCKGFIWDDAYSFYRIIKNILEFNEYRESDLYTANEKVEIIKSYIGSNTYEI
tara:strand:+ start:6032 stop:6667 length:636 start_codon:yes stop_codon:yes gene_type:complete